MSPELEALLAEARDPNTSFGRLWELAMSQEVKVRRVLLDNPNLCPTNDQGKPKTSLLEKLAREFPEEVAHHPLFVLHALVEPTRELVWVVMEVVERTEDVRQVEHVFRSWGPSSLGVRVAMAKNTNTPEYLLRILGNEKTESALSVREAVARNPSTPEDLLRILCDTQSESAWSVRKAVARNPTTPEDLLRTLGNQQTESEWRVRQGVALNPNTPVDIIRTLGNQETESHGLVREAVAWNPSTPEDLLHALGNPETESHEDVRKAASDALSQRGLT